MAVRLGQPVEGLTSLEALLDPVLVEEILNAYWEENGEEPRVYTIDLAWKLLSVARELSAFPRPILRSSMKSALPWRSTGTAA